MNEQSPTFLTVDDLLFLAGELGVSAVRDVGLLDAAAHRPTSMLWGREAYPSLHHKVAVLLESITRNRPLVDGNKRLGWTAVFVFYGLNGHRFDAPEDAAYDLVIAVATGRMSAEESAALLAGWVHPG
ncbi:type II toxin-antitoxin system death-on-curing family toxin [Ruania zhangjianzhongii]|uniref:type II toxin-antitoxin system death-on-curing family toxin n=1 Tax=Ruania zhangjianzhongii TaxID=2603206 RepID=UPI0011CC3A43|nr:Fic family protein [Ruania zhangjianzhongii]